MPHRLRNRNQKQPRRKMRRRLRSGRTRSDTGMTTRRARSSLIQASRTFTPSPSPYSTMGLASIFKTQTAIHRYTAPPGRVTSVWRNYSSPGSATRKRPPTWETSRSIEPLTTVGPRWSGSCSRPGPTSRPRAGMATPLCSPRPTTATCTPSSTSSKGKRTPNTRTTSSNPSSTSWPTNASRNPRG